MDEVSASEAEDPGSIPGRDICRELERRYSNSMEECLAHNQEAVGSNPTNHDDQLYLLPAPVV